MAPRTGRRVAVIGSGPAGLAAAQLNLRGHDVVLFERDEAPGGLMRFGVPGFKLDKRVIDRRVELIEREVVVRYGVDEGGDRRWLMTALAADLMLIAIGFSGPEAAGPVEQLRLRLNAGTVIHAPAFATSRPGVFAAGDGHLLSAARPPSSSRDG